MAETTPKVQSQLPEADRAIDDLRVAAVLLRRLGNEIVELRVRVGASEARAIEAEAQQMYLHEQLDRFEIAAGVAEMVIDFERGLIGADELVKEARRVSWD